MRCQCNAVSLDNIEILRKRLYIRQRNILNPTSQERNVKHDPRWGGPFPGVPLSTSIFFYSPSSATAILKEDERGNSEVVSVSFFALSLLLIQWRR